MCYELEHRFPLSMRIELRCNKQGTIGGHLRFGVCVLVLFVSEPPARTKRTPRSKNLGEADGCQEGHCITLSEG